MINGNTVGIKKIILDQLDDLHQYQIEKDKLLDDTIINTLMDITERINKEILILIDSSNKIVSISIGDDKTSDINTMDIRMKKRGLSGLNCFHTHPNHNPQLSSADFSSLHLLKFNILGAIAREENTNESRINIGILVKEGEEIHEKEFGPFSLEKLNKFQYKIFNDETDKYLKSQQTEESIEEERGVLVGVNTNNPHILDIDDSMDELKELARTAGATPVEVLIQNKERVDNTTYLGKGKLEELKLIIQNTRSNLVICNDELSSIQIKVLEVSLGVKVIDRTALILDIFAKHAKTSEGKLQVELAQLKYRLPRLQGLGKVLSRTGGGIGTRGPGEKKLEVDRRTIYREINILENKIKNLNKIRQQQKSQRQKNAIPQVALVGYTNGGKSTLFNVLTNSEVLSENKLFATLDPTVRKMKNSDREVLLSDTVGFIDKLPHDLVKAFKSTLEDVSEANLLLHIIDSSNTKFLQQIQLVNDVLKSIGCDGMDIIYVFNKIDKKCNEFDMKYSSLRGNKIMISAKYKMGIKELENKIIDKVYGEMITIDLSIPYADMKFISALHELGVVQEENYLDNEIRLKINYTHDLEAMIGKYRADESDGLSNNRKTLS